MDTIVLRITNTTDVDYKKVILRKFFNMIFISEDGKKLSVYTAVVFGGMASGVIDQEGRMMPDYNKKNSCKLRFQYSVNNMKPDKYEYLDISDSFWEQEKYIKEVWGDCNRLSGQSDAVGMLNILYPGKDINTTGSVPNDGFYAFTQKDKGYSHTFVVQKGNFRTQDDYFELDTHGATDGLECLNWINSTLYLKESLLDSNKRVKFVIELGRGKSDCFYTPDFTWYFAPPSGYQVDISKAKVSVGKNKDQMNLVQEVSDDTTVLFSEWEEKERIEERKKARINFKDYTSEYKEHKLSDAHIVEVCLGFLNPRRSGNQQFIMGLLAGFLLAFSADKTRMNDYYLCIKKVCSCSAGNCSCKSYSNFLSVIFPIVVLCAYTSIILNPDICLPKKMKRRHKALQALRIMSAVFACVLAIYIYVFWPVFNGNNLIHDCTINWLIVLILVICSILFSLLYIIYCLAFRKISIYNLL